ncbi:MAG: hypothetical protein JKY34_05270 [Kordiimonadaceae bacterium]|nr:hypothetical protein [Kordiimonadaceae bacterium]
MDNLLKSGIEAYKSNDCGTANVKFIKYLQGSLNQSIDVEKLQKILKAMAWCVEYQNKANVRERVQVAGIIGGGFLSGFSAAKSVKSNRDSGEIPNQTMREIERAVLKQKSRIAKFIAKYQARMKKQASRLQTLENQKQILAKFCDVEAPNDARCPRPKPSFEK